MLIKRKGNILISTMLFLAFTSIIMNFLFKLSINNNEISYFEPDKYDLYNMREEEDILIYKYMKELNKMKDKEEREDEDKTSHMFENDFAVTIEESKLEYYKNDDIFILEIDLNENKIIKRKIDYKIKNKSIILIPTYNYENYN